MREGPWSTSGLYVHLTGDLSNLPSNVDSRNKWLAFIILFFPKCLFFPNVFQVWIQLACSAVHWIEIVFIDTRSGNNGRK